MAQIGWKHGCGADGLQLSYWLKIQFSHFSSHQHRERLLLHQSFASIPGVEKWL